MVETTVSVQTLGIGVSAFIATLIAAFLFINAYKENVARAFAWGVMGLVLWASFGFFSALAAEDGNMVLARQLRLVGLIGNIAFLVGFVRFAFVYKNEHTPLTYAEKVALELYALGGAAFVFLLLLDISGMQILVGEFTQNSSAPMRAGVMLDILVLYYWLNVPFIVTMMHRRFSKETGAARRGGIILVSSMMFAVLIGACGFLGYYSINVPILAVLRALAVPSFAIGAFYAMNTHHIFNVRVVAANFFVFAIWSFLFFRILLNPSFKDSLTDIYLLFALVILGALLIRSFTKELDNRALIERAEKDRAIEEARSEFISIAAHQLRTPLAGIRWTFNTLEGSASKLSPDERALLTKARERTLDVVERVNEMLRAARLTGTGFVTSLTVADIRPILKESVEMFQEAAKAHGLTLNVTIPRKAMTARIDKDKFAIAIQNIIDNAIKYTKNGSVTLSVEQTSDGIEIRILDTGIGITDDDRGHLFEKFYRNANAKKMFTDGSGLGLFIVKKIIDAHGGTIAVESKKGSGSTFIVRIPVAKNG